MKKFFAVMVAALAFAAVASAQPKAVGVRVGNGAEVSYQHYLGGSNFIEATELTATAMPRLIFPLLS